MMSYFMSKRPYYHELKPSENTEMTPHFKISVISLFTRSTERYMNSSIQCLNHFCINSRHFTLPVQKISSERVMYVTRKWFPFQYSEQAYPYTFSLSLHLAHFRDS